MTAHTSAIIQLSNAIGCDSNARFNGVYRIANVSANETIDAITKYLFTKGDLASANFLNDLNENAVPISIRMSVTNAVDWLICLSKPKMFTASAYATSVSNAIINPVVNINFTSVGLSIPPAFLGASSMMSLDGGFNPSVIEGKLSVTKFINRICIDARIGRTGTP